MKFLVALLLTALLAFIAGLQFDWWVIAIAAFAVALLVHQKAWKAFLSGFLGIFILWAVLAGWIDSANNSNLSARIGLLLGIGSNPFLIVMLTGVIGGLIGGFGAMSGSFLRSNRKTKTV